MTASLPPQPVLRHTIAESTPAFPTLPQPPAGAPNVVVIVLDDLGFGQLGCFGSDLRTPNIDGLAADGLRYNRFHVTAMCSPTRAAMLTGRNHHAVGMGFVTDLTTGFPGYNGRIPASAATLPRILRDNGWSTLAVGKWHLIPRWQQSAAGPFTYWPLGQGFERYYGFLAGDTNQWTPDLVSDNGFVDAPRRPEDGYHLTEDLADTAIRLVQDQQQAMPDRPFFLYFATGAMHAPAPSASLLHRRLCRPLRRRLGSVAARAVRPTGRTGHRAAGYHAHRAPTLGARLDVAARRRAPPLRPVHGGLRRLPHPHRRTDRAGARLPAEHRQARRDPGAADLRQRHLRRGRTARLPQRTPLHPRQARRHQRHDRPDRRPRWVQVLQPLPLGLGVGGQHPAQALEALHVARRRAHPARGALAGRHRGEGRDPQPVRPCRRPVLHRARRLRPRASCPGRRPRPAADRRRQPGAHLRRRRRRRRRATRSTSSCSGAGRSTTTDGRRPPITWAPSCRSRPRR